ncbi:hypothetical protein [Psychrobacillus sp. MER TA 171]|uniref:hypothetical protein n=1 Tax=Psychrobacillus sp. MER TA 171 TaxID=2939577 RepID=UPI00203F912C|nr:hypothetical protein [Psychrobacillus sp. MER TA 171]MCM3359534.1 hypothetical protein [Psychrobacillus sp. MER TA 171]
MTEIEDTIETSALPSQLKEYFKTSTSIKVILSKDLLEDVVDLYAYYHSLYQFDTSEFSACVITSIKQCTNSSSFYYYLKKILENRLEIKSKDELNSEYDDYKYIKIEKDFLDKKFKKIALNFIDTLFDEQETNARKINADLGKLELISELMEDEYYLEMYIKVKELKENSHKNNG